MQKSLVPLMGELATQPEDLPRYVKGGFTLVSPEMTAQLDRMALEIEAQKLPFQDWATPGANLSAATLDLARTACRRAERRATARSSFSSTACPMFCGSSRAGPRHNSEPQ
jgi:cob(I)alamin adenosyltransferase